MFMRANMCVPCSKHDHIHDIDHSRNSDGPLPLPTNTNPSSSHQQTQQPQTTSALSQRTHIPHHAPAFMPVISSIGFDMQNLYDLLLYNRLNDHVVQEAIPFGAIERIILPQSLGSSMRRIDSTQPLRNGLTVLAQGIRQSAITQSQ